MKRLIFLMLQLAVVTANASPRSSANYAITPEALDAGGKRITSTNYTVDASAGMLGASSSVVSPPLAAKSGYAGQLYDNTGLYLTAATPTVNEGGTDQLAAWQPLDDGTSVLVPATSVAWSVASGPLAGIDANGLATAAAVYQDTVATAQGVAGGYTATINITVINSNTDNYGSYAGDGLPDAWQVQYFGSNNPLAAPNADFDGDGQNNRFEYTAGLSPADPNSRFNLTIAPVPGQSTQKSLTFSPVVAGRTYTVKATTDLASGIWNTVTVSAPVDNGTQRTVIDTSSNGARKFYRIEITKP